MRSLSGLLGLTAMSLVLCWSAVVNAQPSGAAHASAAQPHEGSTAMSSLICDSSGKVCITVGKRTSHPSRSSTASSNAAKPTPVATSPATANAPELPRLKQQAVSGKAQLICDSSGEICASSHGAIASAVTDSATKQNGAASATAKAAPNTTALVRLSPNAAAGGHRLNQPGSLGHAAIDGVRVYDGFTRQNPYNWVVHAYKSQHRLEVYFKGHLYKTYHAVFGRSLEGGAKVWEGDRRTPEGDYLIVGKHRSSRFGWFLHINYPNERDHERFAQSLAAHLIPASAQEGGQIGIHGTDSPYLNVSEVDWTTGCISVDNADINELARLLPVGTLVIINP
jgi:lipoprotein-anchoring transpeptidase ErfK/SrfK